MPRKSKFSKAEAIEKVMYAIWENGYQQSSVKSLSEMLGITRSSFYNAFGSREALFKEVMSLYEQRYTLTILLTTKKTDNIKGKFTEYFQQLCSKRSQDNKHTGCLSVNSMVELCKHWENIHSDDYEAMAAQSNIYLDVAANSDFKNTEPQSIVLAVLMRDKLELTNEHIEKLLGWAKEKGEIPETANIASLALAITNLNIGINTMSRIVHEEYRLWEAARTTLEGFGLFSEM